MVGIDSMVLLGMPASTLLQGSSPDTEKPRRDAPGLSMMGFSGDLVLGHQTQGDNNGDPNQGDDDGQPVQVLLGNT